MNRNIIAIILIVLAGGMYFTVTKGMLDQAKAVQVVNAEYSSAIANAEKLIAVRGQVLKDYNNLSADEKERLNMMLPNTVDNIRLIIDLNSIAVKRNLTLRNIKAVASTDGQKANAVDTTAIAVPILDTVTVSFSLSAPYREFITFLQTLEADLRIMDLTHLTMSANDTGTYDYSVEFKTYWMRTQ